MNKKCNVQIQNLQKKCTIYFPYGPFYVGHKYEFNKPNCTELYANKKKILKEITEHLSCTPDQITDIWNNIEKCTLCSNNNSGLSSGAIVGIVIGSIVGLILFTFLIYKYKHKRK